MHAPGIKTTVRRMRPRSFAPRCAVVLASLALAACARRGPRDVGDRNYRGEPSADATPAGSATIHSVATPALAGIAPRVLAHASARAIATTSTDVYFGDASDDALLAVPKAGSAEPVRIARRAPMPGALAIDAGMLVWIGSPGDVVLKMRLDRTTAPTTIRDRGIFTGVAAGRGDVFFIEAQDGGGGLTRITGPTTAHLATFAALPRGLAVDDEDAFVVTQAGVLAAPRQRGEVRRLATGAGFGAIALDRDHVLVTVKRGATRAIVRIPKGGGPPEDVVASGVRDAPIAVRDGEVFYFDDARPVVRSPSRLVSEHPSFDRPTAIAADADGLYVAAGDGEDALVTSIALRAR